MQPFITSFDLLLSQLVAETPGWPADRKRYTRPTERCGGSKAALRRNPKSIKRFQVSFRRLQLLAPRLQIDEIEVPELRWNPEWEMSREVKCGERYA